MTTKQQKDHYQEITDAMLALFAQGVKPWAKPWSANGVARLDGGLPHNVASGKNYRGINIAMLWAQASAMGYSTHQWLSYRQAQALGGHVRKGERATMVVFWKRLEKTERGADGSERQVTIPLLRASAVFNVAQCDGLKLPKRAAQPAPVDDGSALGPVAAVVERLALEGGLRHGGDGAWYAPGADAIQLPHAESFASREAYQATALHECGHATGHAKRLKREFSGSFGDAKYAAEELVAELASAFGCAVLGIRSDLERHASYLEHWQRLLTDDKRAFVKACSLAQAACDHMLPAESADEESSDEAPALAQAA